MIHHQEGTMKLGMKLLFMAIVFHAILLVIKPWIVNVIQKGNIEAPRMT
jgi:hypothetical protein